MARNTRWMWCAVTIGATGVLSLLPGCSDRITPDSVRANLSPELETLALTHQQRLNVIARANNVRDRTFLDDLDYLLLIDEPTRLTKYPVP